MGELEAVFCLYGRDSVDRRALEVSSLFLGNLYRSFFGLIPLKGLTSIDVSKKFFGWPLKINLLYTGTLKGPLTTKGL